MVNFRYISVQLKHFKIYTQVIFFFLSKGNVILQNSAQEPESGVPVCCTHILLILTLYLLMQLLFPSSLLASKLLEGSE